MRGMRDGGRSDRGGNVFGSQKLGKEGRGKLQGREMDRGARQVPGQDVGMTVCLGEKTEEDATRG